MKKFFSLFFSLILCLVLISSTVFAGTPWQNGYGTTVTTKTEGEISYYSAKGITLSYNSPTAEISNEIKKAFGNSDSATVTISFKIRATFTEDASANEMYVNTIIRAGKFCDAVKNDINEFENLYEGSLFEKIDSINIMVHNFEGDRLLVTNEWSDVEIELELYKEDLGEGIFEQWLLCFHNYNPLEEINTLELTDVIILPKDASTDTATSAPTKETPEPTFANTPTPTNSQATRPVMTKSPTKTLAPDSAQSIINQSGACTCNKTIPIVSIILASLALAIATVSLIITALGKNKK